jgi:mono/diheme cytochrome c family protein
MKFWILGLFTMVGPLMAAETASPANSPTFGKDVLPLLQKNCQSCHRPGQIGPMSLLNYEEARPWAKAIKAAVLSKKMPPWFADPQYGHFNNDRTLKPQEVDTIAKWVDAGAPAGDPKQAPAPVAWPADGWRIKPDLVVKGAEYEVPKSGVLPWVYVTMPTPFKEDTWVTSMEMRPGNNPSLTHHYCIFIVPHRDDVAYGVFNERSQGQATGGAPFEGCYEKGQEEFDYRPEHAARLIPGNSDMVFQMHYAPNGQGAMDMPQVGFTVTKERPARQFVFFNVGAGQKINIAPGQADYKAPAQEGVLAVDADIVWLQMHAHYRAKQFTFDIAYPDGRDDRLLKVNWNPYWQTIYYPTEVIHAAKGTRLHIEGNYDNSANNVFNPDPTKPVHYGEQAADEMMFPTFGLIVDGSLDVVKNKVIMPPAGVGRDFTLPQTASVAAK